MRTLLALCIAAPAHALTPADAALADVGTTAAAIAAGGVELNPLGPLAIIPKIIAIRHVEQMAHGPERVHAAGQVAGVNMGAAGWNIAMLIAPPLAPIGAWIGYQRGRDAAELTEARNLTPAQCQDYHTARMQRTGMRYIVRVDGCKIER